MIAFLDPNSGSMVLQMLVVLIAAAILVGAWFFVRSAAGGRPRDRESE